MFLICSYTLRIRHLTNSMDARVGQSADSLLGCLLSLIMADVRHTGTSTQCCCHVGYTELFVVHAFRVAAKFSSCGLRQVLYCTAFEHGVIFEELEHEIVRLGLWNRQTLRDEGRPVGLAKYQEKGNARQIVESLRAIRTYGPRDSCNQRYAVP